MNPKQRDDTEQQVKHLATEWTAAELRGDTTHLDRTLMDDFVGVGPRGFMLSKQEWIQRLQSGGLHYNTLALDEVRGRVYGDAAILIGRETQAATYQGQDIPGQFRMTQVWVLQDGNWRLAGLQLSPIMPPPSVPQGR